MSRNGWQEWSRHVLAELKRHNDYLDDLENKLSDLSDSMNKIKIKVALLENQIKDFNNGTAQLIKTSTTFKTGVIIALISGFFGIGATLLTLLLSK